MPPFSDAGPTRHVAWEQLSARWFVEWKNDFETAQAAESFCATLQILLEDLRKVDMALLPSDVSLKIELYDGKLKIEDKSDNERVQLSVFLSRTALAEDGNPKMAIVVQGVATSALNLLSAMPQEQLLQLIEKRAKTGLLNKLFPYESYDKLFREFYLEQNFNAHYEHSCGVRVDLPLFVAETDPGLSGPVGLHPTYDKADSERQIGRRYKAFQSQLKYTLPRLTKDRAFLVAVAELRSKGWKDWHILQAVANVRMNFVLNSGPYRLSVDELKKAGKSLFDREEEPADPILPVELFSVPALKQALIFSQGATLKGLGFEPPQRTPNFSGLDRFLRRFNYWIDDIPHEEIFPSNEQPKDEPFSHER